MTERIRIDHGNLESGKRQIQNWKVPKSVKLELLRFVEDLGLGKVNRGRRIAPERQLKYIYALKVPLEFFSKHTTNLTIGDIEEFEKALTSGKLCTRARKRPYSHSTQVDMRMLLKIFLRWRLGSEKAYFLTNWLDTRPRSKTPEFLKESEVERLYKHCRSAKERFLVAVLFDSGARAEEFHNLRFEDVYLPEANESFVRIALKEEYSKTLGRTVGLYWRFSLEAIKEYLAERVAEGIKPSEPVFHGNYAAIRKFLQRFGTRVLKRPVNYHLFRHSSATFYATKLNRQELCYRYGWRFSSNMPDVYISRAGMESKNLDEKFTQNEMITLKEDLAKMEQAGRIKDNRIRELEDSMRTVETNLASISRLLTLNPTMEQVEAAIQRKSPNQHTRYDGGRNADP